MAANRGFVALVALAVLVWGVAFAGGATVALLTASADVTTTFETPDELRQIDEPTAGGPATLAVGNGTAAENGTAPPANASPANGTAPPANATGPSENASVPDHGDNASAPTGGNVSEPEDGTAPEASQPTNETDAPENASSPPASPTADGNASSPPTSPTADGNASSPAETDPSQSENAGEPPANESTSGGNATEVSAAVSAFDVGPVASDRPNGR